jgi:predicted Zn-dependent peptidase
LIGYHAPDAKSDDYYPLDMLNSILSEGNSSRLYKSLVDEKQLAVDIWSSYRSSLDPNLFSIFAVCAKGKTEETVEKAIYREIDKIVKEGVTKKELQKVKNSKLMDFYRGMETINRRANTIGYYEVFFGGYEKLFNAPAAYRKVTAEDIKRVAAAYLKKSNRTVGILKNTTEEK